MKSGDPAFIRIDERTLVNLRDVKNIEFSNDRLAVTTPDGDGSITRYVSDPGGRIWHALQGYVVGK